MQNIIDKLRLNEDKLNTTIIVHLMAQLMVFRWLRISAYASYIFDLLVLVNFLLNTKKYNKTIVFVSFLICVYHLVSYILFKGSFRNVVGNLRDLFPLFLLLGFFDYLKNNKEEYLLKVIQNLFWPLNIFMILNIIAIHFELQGYSWLAGRMVGENFTYTYFWDSISGLLGGYGVQQLGLFQTLLVIYNFTYAKLLDKKKRIILDIYTFLIGIYSFVISSMNDNKMFYLFFIAFIAIMYFFDLLHSTKNIDRLVIKIVVFILIIIVLVVGLYLFVPIFKNVINSIINIFLTAISNYDQSTGSGERLGIVIYYFKHINILLGTGLGQARWAERYYLGYKHFGISDIGAVLCLGGALLYILINFLFYDFFKKFYKNNIVILIMMLSLFLIMSCTQLIGDFSIKILYILICIVYYWRTNIFQSNSCFKK